MTPLRARHGIVLPAVIGVLVLIELLAVIALAVAYQELAVARERAAATQAQLAGRSGVAQVVAGQHGEIQSLPPGERRVLRTDSGQWRVQQTELERLTSALFLLRNVSSWGPASSPASANTGHLLIGFDPLGALSTLPAALNSSGGVELHSAALEGSASNRVPAEWLAAACTGFPALPDSSSAVALPDTLLLQADSTSLISGSPSLELRPLPDPVTLQQLGGVTLERLVDKADRLESGTVELNPVQAGGDCALGARGNWGAPLDPEHPCHDYFPLVYAQNLEIAGGAGQGTLLVEGNLTLGPGVRFFGLLLVRGRLLMGPGARVQGAAFAQSAALHGATLQRSHCAVRRAFRGARAWNQLQSRRPRAWIPIF